MSIGFQNAAFQNVSTAIIRSSMSLVSADAILGHIKELSDDIYVGRNSPSDGLEMAAGYISRFAAENGLVGANPVNGEHPFYQPFELYGNKRSAESQMERMWNLFERGNALEFGARLFQHAIHQDELAGRWFRRRFIGEYFLWGTVNNVVGILEGSDPHLKDEYVIASAHYDHIGTRGFGADRIYNGASDNASGAAVLMGILPALAALKASGKGPKRSILFIWPAAEEQGLVGAGYYRRNPLVPLGKTKAAVNVDMVGRLSADQVSVCAIDRRGKPVFLGEVAAKVGLKIGFSKVDFNIDQYLRLQDGWVWTDAGIPTAFLFEGFTPEGQLNPDYHTVGDDYEKIIADNEGRKVALMAKLSLTMLLEAANREY